MLNKTFNGITLSKTEMEYVWLKNVQPNGKTYMLYRIIDLNNGMEYTGKKTASSFNELMKYKGSGSLITEATECKPESYFEMQILGFFDNGIDLSNAEAFIVDEDYCLRTDTYNLQPANLSGMGFCNAWYHCPISQKHIRANKSSVAKMKRLGYVPGTTFSFKKRASMASRGVKMWYNNTIVKAVGNQIDEILADGGEFINKRIWMHKPGQRAQSNLKGDNKNLLRPQAANIAKILAYRDAGWEWGFETI